MTEAQTQASNVQLQDIFTMFAVDKQKVLEGVEYTIGGTTFKIARAGNTNFNGEFQVGIAGLLEKFPSEEAQKTQEYKDAAREIWLSSLANHILVGWDQVMYQGEVLAYSYENAKKLLAHDDFAEAILKVASDRTRYLPSLTKADEKN